MEKNKLLGALGLARRAGALIIGFDSVKDAVLSGKAVLVLIAADVADGTRRRTLRICEEDECPVLDIPLPMESVADILHKPVGVLAITDPNLAVLCRKNLSQGEK